LETGSW